MIKNFLKGLLFGSSIGALLGLWFAPDTGDNTRKKLKTQLDEAQVSTDNLTASLHHFKEALETLKKTFTEIFGPLSKDTEKTIEAFKFQVEPRIAQIKEQLDVIQKDVAPAAPKKYVRYYLPKKKVTK